MNPLFVWMAGVVGVGIVGKLVTDFAVGLCTRIGPSKERMDEWAAQNAALEERKAEEEREARRLRRVESMAKARAARAAKAKKAKKK